MNRRIGLIGIPGSGKTALAEAIEKQYILADADREDCFTPVTIIDEYAQAASERLNLAKGFSASWYYDIGVSLDRMGQERIALEQGSRTVITCGTIIESSNYALLNFESRSQFKLENEKEDEVKRIQSAMMTFACLFMDGFRYDKLYFLNSIEPVDEDAKLFQQMESGVRASFEAFDLATISKDLTVEGETSIEAATEKRLEIIGKDLHESASEEQRVESEGPEG